MNDLSTNAGDRAGDWEKLRPVLDEAMSELTEDDRDAVALRFFEERPFADIGRALRLTEDTARKRVERALDKLNAALARRGVTSTMGALGLALANQVATAAPSGLAASAAGAAFTGAGASVAGWASLQVLGSTKMILGAVGTAAALGVGAVVYEVKHANAAPMAPSRAAITSPAKMAGTPGAPASTANVQPESTATAQIEEMAVLEEEAAYLQGVAEKSASRSGLPTQAVRTATRGQPSAGEAVFSSPAPEQSTPPTRDEVLARRRHAQLLTQRGQNAEALKEYLWCFDLGIVQVPGFSGVRVSFLLSDIGTLGKTYPPALTALRERRDAAEKELMRVPVEYSAAIPYAALNRTLGEPERTIVLLDRLPRGEMHWTLLARVVYEDLVQRGRYHDAFETRPYAMMLTWLEESLANAKNLKTPKDREFQLKYIIALTLKNIEVLAGVDDLANTRELIARLLAVDNSPQPAPSSVFIWNGPGILNSSRREDSQEHPAESKQRWSRRRRVEPAA